MEILILIILGLVMGFVTSISGGAGVFGVPAMLAMGIPTINVLALNRMSDVGVVFGALHKYHKSHSIDWKLALIAALPLGIGSFIGANISLALPEKTLKLVILAGIAVGIFFLLKPIKPPPQSNQTTLNPLGMFMLIIVGIWSGALGMAGATFAVLVIVYFFHKNFLVARGTDVVAAIPETLIATTVLSLGANVPIAQLTTMFASSFIGAWIGSQVAVKHGDTFIKRGMVGIAIVMVIKVIISF